ncbi:hypothetical protein T492DRAFT_204170 [Pavlovales sp. CCMP2436]|nr:hypothetical protein T492DRAFT_204170 [Pavlovales sp. CCMP2436]
MSDVQSRARGMGRAPEPTPRARWRAKYVWAVLILLALVVTAGVAGGSMLATTSQSGRRDVSGRGSPATLAGQDSSRRAPAVMAGALTAASSTAALPARVTTVHGDPVALLDLTPKSRGSEMTTATLATAPAHASGLTALAAWQAARRSASSAAAKPAPAPKRGDVLAALPKTLAGPFLPEVAYRQVTSKPIWQIASSRPPSNAAMPTLDDAIARAGARPGDGGVLLVTFVNLHRLDFGLLFVQRCAELGLSRYVIGALDGEALDALLARDLHAFPMAFTTSSTAASGTQAGPVG